MSRPALVTVSMLLNQTSHPSPASYVINSTRSQSSTSLLLIQGLMAFLKIIKVIVPLYPFLIAALMCRPIQRRLLYGHKGFNLGRSRSASRASIDNPELQGFLRNQVTHHSIPTSDGETLHSWLIVPLGTYTKHESIFTKHWKLDEAREIALQCLRDDPKAVLVVYMHGSGNHLATQKRCDAYRNFSGVSPDHLYVLAFDYRGFGKSSGSPTEEGLITDAVSVLSWVEKTLNIPRKKTLLVGQSLGASIAVAAVLKVMETHRYAEYAGIMLCSTFTNMAKIAVKYKLLGIPVLKPLTWSKQGRYFLEDTLLADSWMTEKRLIDLIKRSDVIRLTLVHAVDDDFIPCFMSDILYNNCREALRLADTFTDTDADLGALGNLREAKSGGRLVRQITLNSGGHNRYMDRHTLSFEAARVFTMTGAID